MSEMPLVENNKSLQDDSETGEGQADVTVQSESQTVQFKGETIKLGDLEFRKDSAVLVVSITVLLIEMYEHMGGS